ncbi:hypothetical protein KI387_037859, partial [Taxus chinensis]
MVNMFLSRRIKEDHGGTYVGIAHIGVEEETLMCQKLHYFNMEKESMLECIVKEENAEKKNSFELVFGVQQCNMVAHIMKSLKPEMEFVKTLDFTIKFLTLKVDGQLKPKMEY